MLNKPNIKLCDVLLGLSSALDLVNWLVVNHHRQVTSFSTKLANELGFSETDKSTIGIAAALHDIGAISFNEKFLLSFDADNLMRHAEIGYYLLQNFRPFLRPAELVRYHHLPWNSGAGMEYRGHHVPRGSHILHLADRASILIDPDVFVLKQVDAICTQIASEKGKMFAPEIVDAFLHLADQESFWLEAVHATNFGIEHASTSWNVELDMDLLLSLSDLFRMIIDFRSSMTATHSKDVAHLSSAIARLLGFSKEETVLLHIAGNLHDLGKLAVPVEILEKEGPLNRDEVYVMRSHPFHTYRVLGQIRGIEDINTWASLHHECPDGTGYPFRYRGEELPLGSRIVAVADVLSALTETRSYRPLMDSASALAIMRTMSKSGKLDGALVELVERNLGHLGEVKKSAGDEALREFHKIKSEVESAESIGR
jgi:HD-GYP domain-containing protein (c-di-GMP phosphodiesterase class II)